jgi:hypothetical protein
VGQPRDRPLLGANLRQRRHHVPEGPETKSSGGPAAVLRLRHAVPPDSPNLRKLDRIICDFGRENRVESVSSVVPGGGGDPR